MTLIVGTIAVMGFYSWQLTLITVVVFAPLLPLFPGGHEIHRRFSVRPRFMPRERSKSC